MRSTRNSSGYRSSPPRALDSRPNGKDSSTEARVSPTNLTVSRRPGTLHSIRGSVTIRARQCPSTGAVRIPNDSNLPVYTRMRRVSGADSVLSDLFYVGVALGPAGGEGTSQATLSANTRAFIGARTGTSVLPVNAGRRVVVTGDIVATALADMRATAKIGGGSGSILAAGRAFRPVAVVNGDVEAYAGENARIEGRNITSGGLLNRLDNATPLSNLAR